MANMKQRRRSLADKAVPTPKGVRLDLRIWLYPAGHAGIGTPQGTADIGTMVDDDLELISEFAETLRLVRRELARRQAA